MSTETSPYETARQGVLTSIVRTVVPLVVGAIVSWAAKVGVVFDPVTSEAIASLIGLVIATVFYAVVRELETRVGPAWGWLLLRAKAPEYVDTTAVERIQ